MTTVDGQAAWRVLSEEVPRTPFIPDDVWLYDSAKGRLVGLSRAREPDRWAAAVAADEPIVTQVNLGEPQPEGAHLWPSSSSSMPSVMLDMLSALELRPAQSVLEIGTGTGWNTALLCQRVGPQGHVSTIEIDPGIAERAHAALRNTGYRPRTITGDGLAGDPDRAPFDRIISTARVNETVPSAWLGQLTPGGRLVTPWQTGWELGWLLALDTGSETGATGRFPGELNFMSIRAQLSMRDFWRPENSAAEWRDTGQSGDDFHYIVSREEGHFAMGALIPDCLQRIDWDEYGSRRHSMELSDPKTRSWAELAVDLNGSGAPYRLRREGPRDLWREVVAAYDWWRDNGRPSHQRFGFQAHQGKQWLWLDRPEHIVRQLAP